MVKTGSPSSSDTSITCELCGHLQRDARVLPNCLHSFCFACITKAAKGCQKFQCPSANCHKVVDLGENGLIENLPGNPFLAGVMESSRRTYSPEGDAAERNHRQLNLAAIGAAASPVLRTRPVFHNGPASPRPPAFNNTFGYEGAAAVAPPPSSPAPSIWSNTPRRDNGWTQLQSSSSNSPWRAPASDMCSCGLRVTSRCHTCNDDLCDECVKAHQRVKMTREHKITQYGAGAVGCASNGIKQPTPNGDAAPLAAATPSSPPSGPALSLGGAAMASIVALPEVMRVYADVVELAKAESANLLAQAKQEMKKQEMCQFQVSEMESRVNASHLVVAKVVKDRAKRIQELVEASERTLLQRLDRIRIAKLKALEDQRGELILTSEQLTHVSQEMVACISGANDNGPALIAASKKAKLVLKEVEARCGSYQVHEDDIFHFLQPDLTLMSKLADLGHVSGSGYAANSMANGDGIKKAILGKDARFEVMVRDQLNEKRTTSDDPVMVVVTGPDSKRISARPVILNQRQSGIYQVLWKPELEGEHTVAVTIKGKNIQNSPFKVMVRAGRDYHKLDRPKLVFGHTGEKDGELCRPWGVCCTRDGNIFVANRSNNRIEIFTSQGQFIRHFGISGKQNGQFDRPSSVCCDRADRIIVSDKDNHRIQIFTAEGQFLSMFGEKGSKNGQFNYPWDVACNSKDEILVSDTRNHRIQLFSSSGQFLNKYGFEGPMWKHFDSPRGVCFTIDDQIVVTDFNNHRLLVVKSDFQTAQFLGKEGSDDGMFVRPNGVAVDDEGHIIVADSRNDRIQIFSSSGVFLRKFGVKGTGHGEFDRPSGVCISPDGHVVVVDFGNDRVQVF